MQKPHCDIPKNYITALTPSPDTIFLPTKCGIKQYGGFFTLVTRKGEIPPGDAANKDAYGNAFGIYALVAYYQLTRDTAALALAKKTFYWLETHSHDPVHKGYFQHLQRDGTPIRRTKQTLLLPKQDIRIRTVPSTCWKH